MARVIAFALLLAGCDSIPQTWTESEIAEIAREQSGDAFDTRTEIANLEYRVRQLEAELDREKDYRRKMDDASIADTDMLNKEVSRLSGNDEIFQDHVNYLRGLHGRPPIPSN